MSKDSLENRKNFFNETRHDYLNALLHIFLYNLISSGLFESIHEYIGLEHKFVALRT